MRYLQVGDYITVTGYERNHRSGNLEQFPQGLKVDYISNQGSIRGTDKRGRIWWTDYTKVITIQNNNKGGAMYAI